jgi:exonuclease SbcC
MMRIRKLELENFQSYKNEEVEFEDGVSIIYGSNGAGKSTILRAVFCSLFKTNATREIDDINVGDLVKKGEEEGKLRMEFIHDGEEYEAEWEFKLKEDEGAETINCFIRGNGQTISGVRDSSKFIKDKITGMDAKSFTNCSYIQQSELTALFTSGKKERKKIFDRLLGLNKIEEYKKRAKKARREAKNIRDKYDTSREEIERQLKEDKRNIEELREKRQTNKKRKLELEDEVDTLESEIEELEDSLEEKEELIEKYEDNSEELRSKKEELKKKEKKKDKIENELKELNKKIKQNKKKSKRIKKNTDYEEYVDELESNLINSKLEEEKEKQKEVEIKENNLKQDITNHKDNINEKEKRLDNINSRLSNIKERLQDMDIEEDFSLDDYNEIDEELLNLMERVDGAKRCILRLKERKSTKEEDISTLEDNDYNDIIDEIEPDKDIDEQIRNLKNRVQEKERKLKEKRAEKKEAWDKIVELYEGELSEIREERNKLLTKKEELNKEKNRVEKEITNLKEEKEEKEKKLEEVKQNKENIHVDIYENLLEKANEYEEATETYSDSKERRKDKKELFDDIKKQISEIKEEVEELEEKVDRDVDELKDEKDELKSDIREKEKTLEETKNEIESRNNSIIQIENEIEDIQNLKERREELEQKVEEKSNVVEELNSLMNSYDNVKMEMRKKSVEAMNKYANDIFQEVYKNEEYSRIIIKDNYEIELVNSNGERIKPSMSSGGESAILNIALRASLYKVISKRYGADELPPLMMDEPTTYLDDGHVDKLKNMIKTVKDWNVKQVIIVSHNQTLIDSSDNVYNVWKEKGDSKIQREVI